MILKIHMNILQWLFGAQETLFIFLGFKKGLIFFEKRDTLTD